MSLSKKLSKCFVCFQPTEKFGKTENTFLSVVMLLRIEGHLPYPPKGSPVLIKDWDPCEPCVPKTLNLYEEYAKVQERLKQQRGRPGVRKVRENMATIADSVVSSKKLGEGEDDHDDGAEEKRNEMKRIRIHEIKWHADEEEASPKKIRRRTNTTKGPEEECTGSPFKCPRCPLKFARKDGVARHISAAHEKIRPFKCPKCLYASSYKCNLENHVRRVHKGVRGRAFKCSHCPSSFSTGQNLQRHIRVVHEGARDFKCPHCVKSFTRNWYLRDHVAIVHEGRVLHSCPRPNCKSTFTQKRSVSLHVASFHEKRRDFKCHICRKSFLRKTDCANHVRVAHETKR